MDQLPLFQRHLHQPDVEKVGERRSTLHSVSYADGLRSLLIRSLSEADLERPCKKMYKVKLRYYCHSYIVPHSLLLYKHEYMEETTQ